MPSLNNLKKKFWGKKELPNEDHVIRLCRWDDVKKELDRNSFDLRNRDIQKSTKNLPSHVSTQWLEYYNGCIAKIKSILQQNGLVIDKKSKLCSLEVGKVIEIGKKNDMSLYIKHTGHGHAGIFNIRKGDHKFLRDMVIEAQKNIIND